MDIEKELHEQLDKMPDSFIVGVVLPAEHYDEANVHLLRYMITKKRASGAYVAINKPYNHMINLLKEKNISTENVFFIDCITKSLGGNAKKQKNCIFVESPAHLTDLSITLHEVFNIPGQKKRFLYIDSLSTLSIHNKIDLVLKFVHYITG